MNRLILILLLLPNLAYAADLLSMPVGSVQFYLGAEQVDTMSRASVVYRLVRISGSEGFFMLYDVQSTAYAGALTFTNNRLTAIQRTWGQFDTKVTPTDVGKALFAALDSASKESGPTASVITKTQRTPGGEFKTIKYQFSGGRSVTLLSSDAAPAQGGQQLSISETFAEREKRQLVPSFDIDPDFPDRIMGWACLRIQPWDLAGFYVDCADAHALREEKGTEYIVRHGTKRLATDDFKWYRDDESDHLQLNPIRLDGGEFERHGVEAASDSISHNIHSACDRPYVV